MIDELLKKTQGQKLQFPICAQKPFSIIFTIANFFLNPLCLVIQYSSKRDQYYQLLIHFKTFQPDTATAIITISLISNWNNKRSIRKLFYSIGIITQLIIRKNNSIVFKHYLAGPKGSVPAATRESDRECQQKISVFLIQRPRLRGSNVCPQVAQLIGDTEGSTFTNSDFAQL